MEMKTKKDKGKRRQRKGRKVRYLLFFLFFRCWTTPPCLEVLRVKRKRMCVPFFFWPIQNPFFHCRANSIGPLLCILYLFSLSFLDRFRVVLFVCLCLLFRFLLFSFSFSLLSLLMGLERKLHTIFVIVEDKPGKGGSFRGWRSSYLARERRFRAWREGMFSSFELITALSSNCRWSWCKFWSFFSFVVVLGILLLSKK